MLADDFHTVLVYGDPKAIANVKIGDLSFEVSGSSRDGRTIFKAYVGGKPEKTTAKTTAKSKPDNEVAELREQVALLSRAVLRMTDK